MNRIVIKRDGTKVKWNTDKIVDSIRKAFISFGLEIRFEPTEFYSFADTIYPNMEEIPIEKIQDAIEYYLMDNYPKVAKSYILYRKEREKARDFKYNKKFYTTILELLSNKKNDVSKENANKDPSQFFTMRDLVAGETCKKIYKDFIMDKNILDMNNKGIIHIHDLDYRAMSGMTNCSLINLKDMLLNGTCIQGKAIHDIHSLRVASTIATQIIAAVGSSQYGGITINLSHLSPFVERSRLKYIQMFDSIRPRNKREADKKQKLIDKFLNKEIEDSIQTFQYQLNSLTTTNGQSPFITVACNTNDIDDEYPEYTAKLIEELLKQRIKGMEGINGNNINPSFPKIVYVLAENNVTENSKYYYLTKLAAECTAKRMVPDYVSEKISKELKEGRTIVPMGCVDKNEVIAYKYNDELFVDSFERTWNRFKNMFDVKIQPNGIDEYIDLNNVQIYDNDKFVSCKRIIRNTDKHNWLRLKTSNGRLLTCTEDHPLPIKDKGRTKAIDVKINDKIEGEFNFLEGTKDYNSEKAWVQGVILCDGCYHNGILSATFALKNEDDIIERLQKYYTSKGIDSIIKEWHRGKKGNYKEIKFDSSQDIYKRKKLIEELTKDFEGINKINRKIPNVIFDSNRETRLNFLGGIIDADGYVHHFKNNYTQIEIGSTNKELALDELLLVNSLGYKGKIIENHYNKDNQDKIRYQVSFRCNDEILNYVTCKKKRDNYVKYNENNKSNEFIVTEIKHLDTENKYSYDVTTESDTFSVSGIHSHNCRSFLHPWKDEKGEYKEWGRFNIGVMTINLPYLALESKTIREFINKLEDMVDILSEQQHKVYKTICDSPVDVAPILWMYGGFTRAKSGQKIGEVIPKYYCSASIGYIGLAECVYRFGVNYPTKKGQKLAMMIMHKFYDAVEKNKKKYELAISIYGTPAENTTTTFAKALKDFPIMKNVNDKNYVTNSCHIPVWYKINGYNKILFESVFQKYSTGGHINYIEMPDVNHNPDACLNVMKFIYDNMLYCEMNTTSCDVCYKCGYHGEIQLLGNNKFRCPNCGNEDNSLLYVQRRICGYLGTLTNGISKGREGDISDRVKHF